MPSIKRSSSAIEADTAQNSSRKSAKLRKNARIKELESQVAALNDFALETKIDKELPSPIVELLQNYPGAATKLDAAIRSWIIDTYDKCENKSSNSCTLSNAMTKYLPDIERLSRLPDGLNLAYHLVLFLGWHTLDWEQIRDECRSTRPSD
ncbi:uncharacterized protein PAC_10347 [Phialocephala subalpina]|uniref:Uncharacterized protein n=1 Tax=Phialocephala subalpina TaxID=576137 RepID=A0A1L7X603_9HELO|nr:uncharacterized protein PAC_10347 [Phialocephala subalpina]